MSDPADTEGLASLGASVVRSERLQNGVAHEIEIPVADPRSGQIWRCAANLTVPAHARAALQILVHGATYNRWYWDPGSRLNRYSYVQVAASHGYPTINIDRIGCGRSDHPDGADLSLDLHATTVNTVASLARQGLADHSFDRIIGVGHSVGTYVLMKTLSGAHGLDAALLTGITHRRTGADPVGLNIAASEDPHFADRNSVGYLTLPAPHRQNFYHLPTTEAAVLGEDIRHRDVVGLGELHGIAPVVSNPCLAAVPLCLAIGMEDWMFAAEDTSEFRREEAEWYPNATALDYLLYAQTGHNINMHKAGPRAMSDFLHWIESVT
jgi:pimeloyl-ACP methyl ester carboxylesterase